MIHGLKKVCVRLNIPVIASELRPELHACGVVVVYHGPMVDSNIETEAKWRVDEGEHERIRTELRRAGASHSGTVDEIKTPPMTS